ncbi:hypothetical protein [Caryophanon tenue]|uniref:hypothetical protein n=1 Tax=Caryophanon tenue TaxID=33978 RepID=UPI001470A6B9|nr:hypothetical protein [Caryophanon tenue]
MNRDAIFYVKKNGLNKLVGHVQMNDLSLLFSKELIERIKKENPDDELYVLLDSVEIQL